MFAKFGDIPAMKRSGRTHGRADGQRENSIPTTNKVCGGIINLLLYSMILVTTRRHLGWLQLRISKGKLLNILLVSSNGAEYLSSRY